MINKKRNKDVLRAAALIWKSDRNIALINSILQIIQALLPIATLYTMKVILDAVVNLHKSFESILPLIILSGITQVAYAAVKQFSLYINNIHQQKLNDYLAEKVLTKAIEADFEYYENPEYHNTLHLAQQQSTFKATELLNSFNSFILNGISLVILIGFFFTLKSYFALLFLLFALPLVIIKWYSGFALLRLEQKFSPLEREANYLYQTLTGVHTAKEVRVFSFGLSFIRKFKKIRSTVRTHRRKLDLKFTYYSLIAEIFEIIAVILIFGLLAKETWEKNITVGVLVVYMQGFQRLQGTSRNFLQAMVQIFQQRLFLRDLFAFFDIEIVSPGSEKPFPQIKQSLQVNAVSFKYPQTSRSVLKNMSLNFPVGKVVAIVGENGSGKSTLVKLLSRLYHTQAGSILIDGVPISDIKLSEYRANTGFMFQDSEKYHLTIKENIALGDSGNNQINQKELGKAASLSGAHPFISKLSKGYSTRMGRSFKGSEQLSGGHWQKIALARIFYRKAQLLVLDEPTSALDVTAELEVFKNIKGQLKDKIVILITHRLYNLKMADYIYLMHDGEIVEEGDFDALIYKGGSFTKLYEAQKL